MTSDSPKAYKDFTIWCREAELDFTQLNPTHLGYLRYIFSFLTDNSARKLASYLAIWDAFDRVFWTQENHIYYLDERIDELINKYHSGVIIVDTGLVGATGVSKSWSSIAMSLRYSAIHGGDFTLQHILMDESEMSKIKATKTDKGFQLAFYILDDPTFSKTGIGVERLKQMLKNFSRQISRKAKKSLFVNSAIDIFKNKNLRLDGVHFYLEMWGYNPDENRALGMLYDNDLSPIGWVYINSPITAEIRYYDSKESEYKYLTIPDVSVGQVYDEKTDSMKDIQVSLHEFIMRYYEQGLKQEFIEKQLAEKSTAVWFQYVGRIQDLECYQDYSSSKTNLMALVARELSHISGQERDLIVTELWVQQQHREMTESITSITGKYFIDSEIFEFDLNACLDDLALSSAWNREVDAYRLNKLSDMSQDDIVHKWREERGLTLSQMTISNYVHKVDGELSRIMGANYERFLTEQYEQMEDTVKVDHDGNYGRPDLVVEYSDGQIEVISIKCYIAKRGTVSIPLHEIEAEIRHARRLINAGETNVYVILEFLNYFTKQRIRKIIAHNSLDSLPPTISLKLQKKRGD